MTYNFEDILDSIRVELYEQTKELKNKEVVEATNLNASRIAEQYGINIVKKAASANK